MKKEGEYKLSTMGQQFLTMFGNIQKDVEKSGKDWKYYFSVSRGTPMNYIHRKPFRGTNILTCWMNGTVYTITKTQLTKIKDEVCGLRGLPVEGFKNDAERQRVEEVRRMAYKKFEEEGGKLPSPKLYPVLDEEGNPVIENGKPKMHYNRIPIVTCFPKERKDRKTGEPVLNDDGEPIIDFGYSIHWEFDIREIENYDFHVSREDYQPKEFISHEKAEEMLARMVDESGVKVFYDTPEGEASYYRPLNDTIHLSERKWYDTIPYYFYSVFSHEFGHSTGAKDRMNRAGVVKEIGILNSKDVYAEEELVAQFFAIIMMKAEFGINETYDNDVKYIASWWEHLKKDPNKFARAFNDAYKAYEWIMAKINTKEIKEVA